MKEQILLGSLLGDAFIPELTGRRKTYSIRWEHSYKQREYALWKADNSLNNYSIYQRSRLDNRTNNIYQSIVCYSIKDNYIKYRKLFYNDKKQVNIEILNLLQPLGIAVWFMDDGNLYYNGNNCHLNLAVHSFNSDIIIDYFKNKWELNFKKNGKSIRLTSVKEVKKFESYFSSFYHESMNYKKLEYAKKEHKNKK